jgi:diguanylate cyclase (GGDEF)-like protein/PAS domain S-box-containing protein
LAYLSERMLSRENGMNIQTKILLGFAISMMSLFTVGLTGYRTTQNLIETADWVAHTHEVKTLIESVVSELKDSETGQRGYLLTGNPSYLEPYESGKSLIDTNLSRLRYLTVDNSMQQERIGQITMLANEKLKELKETIDLYKAGNRTGAFDLLMSDRGKQLMDDIRAIIHDMKSEEAHLLVIRQQASKSAIQLATLIISIGFVLAFSIIGAILVFTVRGINRDINERKQENITARKLAEEKLKKSHALYSQAERMGRLGHWEWDAEADRISNCSEQYANIFEMTVEEVFAIEQSFDDEVLEYIHEDDRERYIQVTEIAFERKEKWDVEFRAITQTGKVLYVREIGEPEIDEQGTIIRTFGTLQDITDSKLVEERLSYQASHDELTGLINRREFEKRAERLLSTINQDKSEHALCFMDLDQFKIVNDTCGHTAGDELLRQISSMLTNTVRYRDTLARLGGDEFGVLMEHCSLDDAHRVASSLQKTVQDFKFTWQKHDFKIGVSIGLVPVTSDTSNLTELMKQADAACYMAKDQGRNRIHVYHPEDTDLAKRHGEMQWVERINQALEDDLFCLYAQPIVSINGNGDTGTHYELLIRMKDENGDIIPPDEFLPAAERYNLITKIDCWVIEHAIDLLANDPVFLKNISFCSINLSGQSLTNPNMLKFIINQVIESEIQSEKICFEITETAAISNLNGATKFISTLKGLGCQFALDDFGSGLSSFAYLKNLPVDYLKIDGMFVKDIADDPIDYAMVKSINEIGQVMGMQTIAECVENDAIKGILKKIGVNYVQGNGIGKPQPFDALLWRSSNVVDIKIKG